MNKMENKQFAVGLDIGTTKIVAMVGQKNKFNKVEIIGIGKSKSLGVHRGVVNNITQTIQSIQEAVNRSMDGDVIYISEGIYDTGELSIENNKNIDLVGDINLGTILRPERITINLYPSL